MNRRDFLKVSGAALVAAHLPADVEQRTTKTSLPYRTLPPGDWTGRLHQLPVRRRVIFYSRHDDGPLQRKESWPLPPVGTVVGSDEYLCVFRVIPQADSLPCVPHVANEHDTRDGIKSGIYEGVLMTVEAVGSCSAHKYCNIRYVVSPQENYPYSVCEAWRNEFYRDWMAESYVTDALYPERMKKETIYPLAHHTEIQT